MGPSQILIVDDEVGIRELLSEILEDEGYQVRLAENASQARDIRNRMRPDLVLLDIWSPTPMALPSSRSGRAEGCSPCRW